MLDNGILGHCQFAEPMGVTLHPPGGIGTTYLYGYVRKKDQSDQVQQAEINALFTVGRLLREKKISAFTYNELSYEGWKRRIGETSFSALDGCEIGTCPTPIERSRFRQTVDFMAYTSKGGRKDRNAGRDTSNGQIAFIEWLIKLNEPAVEAILGIKEMLGLTPFEVDSLRNLQWLQTMCRSGHSTENYPDMFHVWAAQRNRMDVLLTLEKRLPNTVASFPKQPKIGPTFPTQVIRPQELLKRLGISEPDPAPIKTGWFYPLVGRPFQLDGEVKERD